MSYLSAQLLLGKEIANKYEWNLVHDEGSTKVYVSNATIDDGPNTPKTIVINTKDNKGVLIYVSHDVDIIQLKDVTLT